MISVSSNYVKSMPSNFSQVINNVEQELID